MKYAYLIIVVIILITTTFGIIKENGSPKRIIMTFESSQEAGKVINEYSKKGWIFNRIESANLTLERNCNCCDINQFTTVIILQK